MSEKRIAMTPEARARRLNHAYKSGDKVLILRGRWKGLVCTVRQSANDWATLDELRAYPQDGYVQSKRNLEPA